MERLLIELQMDGGPIGWIARNILKVDYWIKDEFNKRETVIGGVDNMWLLLSEVADFNPVCASTYTLKGKLSLEDLQKTVLEMANKFPRYKQRLMDVGRKLHGPRFVPDPYFNINRHVHTVTLPSPAGESELNDLMGKFIAQQWDLRRPLWEMILVENYRDTHGAKCALITRAHHTLADGQGFVLSQLSMTSYYDELRKTMDEGANKLRAAKRGELSPSQVNSSLGFLDPLAANTFTEPVLRVIMACIFWVTATLSAFFSLFWSTYQGLHQVFFFILTFWRVEMLTESYSGPRVTKREFCSSKVFNMEDIKICQKAFSGPRPTSSLTRVGKRVRMGFGRPAHVTLNDVMCSVMADAIGEEMVLANLRKEQRGGLKHTIKRILPSPIGFFIPISIRIPGDWSMRNQSTGSTIYLNPSESLAPDVSTEELYTHIHACRRELSLLKHSLWPRLTFDLIQLTGQAPITWPVPFALLPKLVSENIRDFVRNWITIPVVRVCLESIPVILTNVPGPSKPLTISGVRVIKWTALPPQAGKGTVGIGVISNAGGICISVAADKVPGTEGVTRRLCQLFEKRFSLYVERAKEIVEQSEN